MGDEDGDPGSNDHSQAGDGDEPRSGPVALIWSCIQLSSACTSTRHLGQWLQHFNPASRTVASALQPGI